eukprot:3767474-Lingulodinium_polyedra.AAC.1
MNLNRNKIWDHGAGMSEAEDCSSSPWRSPKPNANAARHTASAWQYPRAASPWPPGAWPSTSARLG